MGRRTTTVVAAGLVVTLLLAGAVSYFASDAPDGLNKVAIERGFDGTEQEHDLADSPFAGYETRGVEGSFWTGSMAGIAGVGVCFLVAGGMAYLVRRRGSEQRSRTRSSSSGEPASR